MLSAANVTSGSPRNGSALPGIEFSVQDLPSHETLLELWRELETRSDTSFFVSWSWIGTWLRCLPRRIRPQLLVGTSQGRIVCLGVLVRNLVRRRLMVRSDALFLNACGEQRFDEITIEHNGVLVDREFAAVVWPRLVRFFVEQQPGWDEIHLPGVDAAGQWLEAVGEQVSVQYKVRDCHHVDLNKVRTRQGGYLALLSGNTRSKIRRSIREYESLGPLSLAVATNLHDAQRYFGRLKNLHQAYWTDRGEPGSFANRFLDEFHEQLIQNCFERGEIQLCALTAGSREIGYLYNFVHRGRVSNYQSGLSYVVCGAQNRPGLVAHSLAVQWNADHGHLVYDFLAGTQRYKESLGTDRESMTWAVLQRDLAKFRLESTMRAMKDNLAARLRRR